MQAKEVDYKGKKLVYRCKGEGALVVLLHGFGEDARVWNAQYDLFPGHQLVIPDLPGSGKSEIIADMSMDGMADAIFFVLEKEFDLVDGATIIGHSMGGYITLAFAEKYPDRLNAFGLFHSTAFADTDERKETRKKGIQFMKEHGGFEFLKTAIPNLYSPETKQTNSRLIEKHLETVGNANTGALIDYYEAMMQRPDRISVLINSKVPVLFVLGKHDTAVPVEDGLKQCHLPQLSYIHVLPQSGHMGMKEEEKQSNQILSQFVTTVENIAYT